MTKIDTTNTNTNDYFLRNVHDIQNLPEHVRGSIVGLDRILNQFFDPMPMNSKYPPHNIQKISDTSYRLVMAIAGFTEKDLTLTLEGQILSIVGELEKEDKDKEDDFPPIYQGLALRRFVKYFKLLPHMIVEKAKLENGLLTINFEIVIPESEKPKVIKLEK